MRPSPARQQPTREAAAWASHLLRNGAPDELGRVAASDPSAAARFAAAWGMPADSAVSRATR
jgi:hypothetical protein